MYIMIRSEKNGKRKLKNQSKIISNSFKNYNVHYDKIRKLKILNFTKERFYR